MPGLGKKTRSRWGGRVARCMCHIMEQEGLQIPRGQHKARVTSNRIWRCLNSGQRGSSRKNIGNRGSFLSLARICTPNVNTGPGCRWVCNPTAFPPHSSRFLPQRRYIADWPTRGDKGSQENPWPVPPTSGLPRTHHVSLLPADPASPFSSHTAVLFSQLFFLPIFFSNYS